MRRTALASLFVVSLALTGCSPPQATTPSPAMSPAPSPAMSPTPSTEPSFAPSAALPPSGMCTPDRGGAAYPCDQPTAGTSTSNAEAYAAAEKTARDFIAEDARLRRDPAQAQSSARLKELVAPSWLPELQAQYAFMVNLQQIYTGDHTIAWVKRLAAPPQSGSTGAVEVCTQWQGGKVIIAGKPVTDIAPISWSVHVATDAQGSRITRTENKTVATC